MDIATDLDQTIDTWINSLGQKTFAQLCVKPAPESWSLGQLSMHLIEATQYYLEQSKICLSTNDHEGEEMSPAAKAMFDKNEFPDVLIEGPPSNDVTPQPESKEELLRQLRRLREEVNKVEKLISTSSTKGKTRHPGLRYFTAKEWFQFADMHFRHHFRQMKRIQAILKF